MARDDKKNPLISTFEWAEDATQRILRVPAGFMRNKTQERVEGLARERALTAIDLGLVEEGIEIGKKIMAEVIAAYPNAGKGAAAAARPGPPRRGERRGVEVGTMTASNHAILRTPKPKLKWSRPSATGAATSTR